ncbi:MAG: 3-deoxy-manno-octulosonate-8-phosphatase KdsC [Gammaproteobacteria bacterium]|nr:3-deoxy-manno-octulosonate-8-phosphatase KdsC [Gammaproteobacteria bacterium]
MSASLSSLTPELLQRAAAIKLVIFDVDGVLTDGTLFLGDDGQEYKAFNSRDGLGMMMLQRCGITIGIITARQSNVVQLRMQSLGITHLYQGQQEKLPAYEKMLETLHLAAEQVAYVGDDLIDLPIMTRAGIAIAVADAQSEVIARADWVTPRNGGHGAARDVCELIMRGHQLFDQQLAYFLR